MVKKDRVPWNKGLKTGSTESSRQAGVKRRISKEKFMERMATRPDLKFAGDFEKDYKTLQTKLDFKCIECEGIFQTTFANVYKYDYKCPYCVKNRKGKRKGHKVSPETYARMSKTFKKKLTEEQYYKRTKEHDNFVVLSPYSEYKRVKTKLRVKCKTCGDLTRRSIIMLDYGTYCHKCKPNSKPEREIADWVKTLINTEVIENTRKLIFPYEVDIYVPESNLAIEFNGLYWHSEAYKKKDYHLKKTLMCEERGVNLFHIFEDLWRDKEEIIKSMIKYRLNKVEKRVGARKCVIEVLKENKEYGWFFDQNHISGRGANSSIAFALRSNNEIVACLSLRKGAKRYKKYYEIARFAVKNNVLVPGAFSRLLKQAIKFVKREGDRIGILSYADLLYGTGAIYQKNGFRYEGRTEISYWYTDFLTRFSRQKFRRTSDISEKELARFNKVKRIYGCGSNIYVLDF